MTIYIVLDGEIKTREYEDVANLESFEREMDEAYPEIWFYDIGDAEQMVHDQEIEP